MSRAALEQRAQQSLKAEIELDRKLLDITDANVSDDLVAAAMNGKSLGAAMNKLPGTDQVRTLVASICQCRSDRLDALTKLRHSEGDIDREQARIRDSDADALQRQVDAHLAEIEVLDQVRYGPLAHIETTTEHKGRRYGNLVQQPPGRIQQLRDEATALRRQAHEAEQQPILGSGSVTVELPHFQADPLDAWEEIEAELYRDPMLMQPAAYEIRQRLNGDELRKRTRDSGTTGDTSAPWELRIRWQDSVLREVALLPAAAVKVA